MLKEISCDKFRKKVLIFNEGLNVVLGDDEATNSIGKSTMLMIIDFVFGGNTYIKSNHDAIDNLGHHEFKFKFLFDEELYFTRSTNEYKSVSICDSNYKELEKIKTSEYTELLKRKYSIYIGSISFRDIVGRYARIWGKENLEIGKPLQYVHKEAVKKSITALIKLFDKYEEIVAYEKQIEKLTDEKKLIQEASKKNLIPKMNVTTFKKNKRTIDSMNMELEVLKKNIKELTIDVEALLSKEIFELKDIKSQLIKKKNMYESRLKRTRNNIKNKSANINSELAKLIHFFPKINVDRINEINEFHNSMTVILKNELKHVEKDIVNQMKIIEDEIVEIDKQIYEKLNMKDIPKYALDKIVEISTNIQKLNSENEFYLKEKNISEEIESAGSDFKSIKSDILLDIGNQINNKMSEINKSIYSDNRRAPALELKENNYIFKTFGDTGTGTAYANLIAFDIAVFDLTELPVIIHDLPLFKNVENPAMQNIINIYNQHKKQIFIAIDEVYKYNKEIVEVLKDKSFIQLSKDSVLFTMNWKNK
ncbi:DUF2326 domain-containing protein [Clostridium saccharoperbutylacetonicum]|uniref:DUF2326 domain-containing protein n=1 Tax=Clostridium saccharoperbutylacetonicum TaxID=36745 RepID=UPI000983B8A3|nr:DUF2326 domain-containing protein [Clostridium saccharoperbutylacetonicum]AQR93407.1 hypothetical protein CLSAP_07050 [Clostridium saccharoperbutylacetonicum]NSB29104.1 hypothetical protein [Clostridium saccharoperbutylacetonicum]